MCSVNFLSCSVHSVFKNSEHHVFLCLQPYDKVPVDLHVILHDGNGETEYKTFFANLLAKKLHLFFSKSLQHNKMHLNPSWMHCEWVR